jgi:hypothetical protein
MRVSDAVITVSIASASEPRWRADGKELFYLERIPSSRRSKLVAVAIRQTSDNPLGPPRPLFEFTTLTAAPQTNAFAYSPSARWAALSRERVRHGDSIVARSTC